MHLKSVRALIALAAIVTMCIFANGDKKIAESPQVIVRKPLLTAFIEGQKSVDRVEVKEINFVARQKTGLHLHPCPAARRRHDQKNIAAGPPSR